MESRLLAAFLLLAGCGDGPSVADAGTDAAIPLSDAGQDAGVPDPVAFRETGWLAEARVAHAAVRAADGRVVVIGGYSTSGRDVLGVEVYDPVAETWSELARLTAVRENHTATLLPSGRILIAGGGGTNDVGAPAGVDVLATCLLLDPMTGELADAAPMHVARSGHSATLLPSGELLVAGGATAGHTVDPANGDATASAEIYDPGADRWREVEPLDEARYLHTATLFGAGLVAVVSGSDETEREMTSVEIFDPATETWSRGPELGTSRVFHATEALPSGGLLVAAGKLSNRAFLETTERLDAAAAGWAPGPSLVESRTAPTLTALPSGRLLLTGGLHGSLDGFYQLADASLYDEATGAWTPIAPLQRARVLHRATLLQDGSVLVCGGTNERGALTSCERTR